MRVLFIDVDSLRPDHLGCYGYHRDTSPTIDALAQRGIVFEQCFASDVPCLPSRTSTFSGRFGYTHGAVCHEGPRSVPFDEHRAISKGLRTDFARTSLPSLLRDEAGYRTASISSFSERHSAFHFLSGFSEFHDTGGFGNEQAEDVTPLALNWLKTHAAADNWFLHVQYWDVHTPYRTSSGTPHFVDEIQPGEWPTQPEIDAHRATTGVRSAADMLSVSWLPDDRYPLQPRQVRDTADVGRIIDEYDRAIRHVDDHIGQLMGALREQGVADDVLIVITADHGENLGELNSYCGHTFADRATTQVPLVVHWPSVHQTPVTSSGFVYQLDVSALLLEACGIERPDAWDAQSPLPMRDGSTGRPYLVLSQFAQACQRSVVFEWEGRPHIMIKTYCGAYYMFPEYLLFDLENDPRQMMDVAETKPEALKAAISLLEQWLTERSEAGVADRDPLIEAVAWRQSEELRELPRYSARLASTGREACLEELRERFGYLREP